MNLNRLKSISLAIIVITFSLYTYRSVFSGKLLGEPFDARLMISLHEHMWRWLSGLVSFRDTEFFYPYETALGFSDVFLVQGLIYSVFRFFGLDSLSSWINVTIILVIIGNLGWILFAKKYLRNFITQILFVISMISSVSFVHYFTFNPNIVGYSFLSWMIIFYLNLSNEKKLKNFHIKVNLFIIALLLYALSCWYAAFFLLFTIFLRFIILTLSSRLKFNTDRSVIKIYIFFAPFSAFFSWIFYYVYISIAALPERSIEELIENSPRIQYLLIGANPNGGGMDGSILHNLYKFLNLTTPIVYGEKIEDWGGGLGIVLPFFLTIVIFANIFVAKLIKDYSWLIAVSITYFYFTVFGNNLSLHSYLFNVVPGLNSIRSPSRYVIFVGYAAIFFLFLYFDRVLLQSKKYFINIMILFSMILVITDQHRNPFTGWSRENFINTELLALKMEVKNNCDYFYYDRPGGWWFDQIEALAFAVQIGVPTVNGYSGAFPTGYPNKPWNQDAPSLEIFDWMKQIDLSKRGCLILGNSNIRYLSDSAPSLDFYGFTAEESNGSSNWRWAVSKQTYILVVGPKGTQKELEFEIKSAPCFENLSLDVGLLGEKLSVLNGFVQGKQKMSLVIEMGDRGAEILQFSTEVAACKISGDPRNLFFEIKNLKLI